MNFGWKIIAYVIRRYDDNSAVKNFLMNWKFGADLFYMLDYHDHAGAA